MATENDSILTLEGVSKSFGGLTAVDDVSLTLDEEGAFYGIIGPNGAGKSTLVNVVTGVLAPDRGHIQFDGHDVTDNSLARNVDLGLVRTFQTSRVLHRMTVEENLKVASQKLGFGDQDQRITEYLSMIEMEEMRHTLARELSFGQQKLVSLAQALLLDPQLVLLDEPFAGINPALQNKLLEVITDKQEDGVTFMVIEHDVETILTQSDQVIVMNQGAVLLQDTPETVKDDERVIEVYFGA